MNQPAGAREFCNGCDHGVVAGHVCELCGGTGYKERRQQTAAKDTQIALLRGLNALLLDAAEKKLDALERERDELREKLTQQEQIR